MPIYYDSKNIIPAPLVSIQKQYLKSGNGENVGVTYSIILTGTLVAFKGSPSGGTVVDAGFDENNFWTISGYPPDETLDHDYRLKSILAKQGSIRKLFTIEGKILEIIPLDGSTPLSCNPRVLDIQFEPGIWYDRCEYTITLEADALRQAGILIGEDVFTEGELEIYIVSADESWVIEEEDQRTSVNQKGFRLTHTVSAVGKRFYDSTGVLVKQPWERAKDWVKNQLGFNAISLANFTSDIVSTPITEYNHVINETVDERSGSFTVTETWFLSNDSATEDFTVTTRLGNDVPVTTVTIEGTISGLESDIGKYTNASVKFASVQALLYSRAQTYSGVSLNSVPLNYVIGKNPVGGVITYTYEYDTRPSSFIDGAKSEIITIIDTEQADVFTQIAVPGRLKGPILQDVQTRTAFFRTVSIEVVVDVPTSTNWGTIISSKPETDDIVADIKATLSDVFQIFVESDENSWSPLNGRYSRQIRWIAEFN